MIKSTRAMTLASALLFSMGAMAQSGSGNPTQNIGKDNPNTAQPGGATDSSASNPTPKHKAKHKKSASKTTDGTSESDGTTSK